MASKRCDACRKDKVQLYTCQVCRTGAYCGSQCQIAKMSEGLHKMCLIGNHVPPPPPSDAGRFALIRWLSDRVSGAFPVTPAMNQHLVNRTKNMKKPLKRLLQNSARANVIAQTSSKKCVKERSVDRLN